MRKTNRGAVLVVNSPPLLSSPPPAHSTTQAGGPLTGFLAAVRCLCLRARRVCSASFWARFTGERAPQGAAEWPVPREAITRSPLGPESVRVQFPLRTRCNKWCLYSEAEAEDEETEGGQVSPPPTNKENPLLNHNHHDARWRNSDAKFVQIPPRTRPYLLPEARANCLSGGPRSIGSSGIRLPFHSAARANSAEEEFSHSGASGAPLVGPPWESVRRSLAPE